MLDDPGLGMQLGDHGTSELALILVGACDVAGARRVSDRSRKRRCRSRMIVAPALGAVVAGGAAHGAFHRNSPIFGPVIAHLRGDEPLVALTFDDGPNPDATPADSRRARGARRQSDVLHSRPPRRTLAGARAAHRRRGACDRQSRLLSSKAALQVARVRAGRSATRHQGDRRGVRRTPGVLPRTARLSQSVGDVHRAHRSGSARSAGRSACGIPHRPGVEVIAERTVAWRETGLDSAACTTVTATILRAIGCRRHARCL